MDNWEPNKYTVKKFIVTNQTLPCREYSNLIMPGQGEFG